MTFRDRVEAGERLGEALCGRQLERPVVLGIPRGGIVVAERVARALGADLVPVVALKVCAPGRPDVALGGVTADGAAQMNRALAEKLGVDEIALAFEMKRRVDDARRREALFHAEGRPALAGRAAVIVDDGVVSGATGIAAVRWTRRSGADPVIFAAPVGCAPSLRMLRRHADEVVCLVELPRIGPVVEQYESFLPVGDEEVVSILEGPLRAPRPRPMRPLATPPGGNGGEGERGEEGRGT
jgi:predicted phosphoribosyltransferase